MAYTIAHCAIRVFIRRKDMRTVFALCAALALVTGAYAQVYDYSVAGIESWDAYTDPDNVVVDLDLAAALGYPSGTYLEMTGIGWDVDLETYGGSWLSEIKVYFDDNIAPDGSGLFLTPAVADGFPGSGSYASGGVLDLTDNGIPDIPLPNGILRMEFYEGWDDVADAADGLWVCGCLNIQAVPEPASLALLGLGTCMLLRRR
jgi:hypothetical protein